MQLEQQKVDRVFRPKEAAAKLGVARQTIYTWAKLGLLPAPTKYGPRASGWRESVLDEFLRRRELAPAT